MKYNLSKIPLVKDTIDNNDIDVLINWLKTYPRLTKFDITIEFEKIWSKWLGVKYSVYINSGSSANLAMIYSLLQSNKLKNNKIIVPSVSWVTTVSPCIQFGMQPILCECDKDTLGLDVTHFEKLCKEESPSCVILVHILGFPNKMNEILDICNKYGVILLEDSCETVGSTYNNNKTGTFGLMSSFSFYFGHHMSTIEGGMICTDDKDLHNLLLSIRSHGWSRDLDVETQKQLKDEYNIDDFKSLYTFFYPGFNLRSTDLQAKIGIDQMNKIDEHNIIRNNNYKLYHENIFNDYWKINPVGDFISNFNYPIIHPKKDEIVKKLIENNIECRPLVCGSIGRQPFWKKIYGETNFDFADMVDNYGLYIPNNHQITEEEMFRIINTINSVTKNI